MAATLASVCSVPLTSVLLLFELTKDYRILLPLKVISFLILLMSYSIVLFECITCLSKLQRINQFSSRKFITVSIFLYFIYFKSVS